MKRALEAGAKNDFVDVISTNNLITVFQQKKH